MLLEEEDMEESKASDTDNASFGPPSHFIQDFFNTNTEMVRRNARRPSEKQCGVIQSNNNKEEDGKVCTTYLRSDNLNQNGEVEVREYLFCFVFFDVLC